jgi:hypothetical protein
MSKKNSDDRELDPKITPWMYAPSDGEKQTGWDRSICSYVFVDEGLVLKLHPLC